MINPLNISPLTAGSKVTGGGPQEPNPNETVSAVIKVSEADYVPKNVQLRSRIDAYLIIVECRYGAISLLETDPRVDSVDLPRPLQMID